MPCQFMYDIVLSFFVLFINLISFNVIGSLFQVFCVGVCHHWVSHIPSPPSGLLIGHEHFRLSLNQHYQLHIFPSSH